MMKTIFKERNTYFIETLTSNHLKYKQDSSTLSVPLEYKEFIKDTVAFTKALHYDHSYYHTAFSAATYPPTEHIVKIYTMDDSCTLAAAI